MERAVAEAAIPTIEALIIILKRILFLISEKV